jgi:hypothetical protein
VRVAGFGYLIAEWAVGRQGRLDEFVEKVMSELTT